jgi:hypothetical protein
MHGDWIQKDEKVETTNQEIVEILAKMNKNFEIALEALRYEDKRW